jgi:hypothetical protein
MQFAHQLWIHQWRCKLVARICEVDGVDGPVLNAVIFFADDPLLL